MKICYKMKGGVNGQISLAQMKETFEGWVLILSMARDISALTRSMTWNAEVDEDGEYGKKKSKWYQHSAGIMRRVFGTWKFPMLALHHMYEQWHYGNKLNESPPAKYLANNDISFLGSSFRVCLNRV